ncbi:hypothetical protein [Paenibacillus polymyxa]|uniref:hypothetical protein n=1 Tax=Paenibacillus polymyxa TaxID=1406 RepID=UPI002AB53C45|nr:hypothetical protein [Paenibacillus polymyxa]MDY8021223.1 hypothetical protein [Paenibacillus polymyxa]
MYLGFIFKQQLENQGRTIAWLADKLEINEKTLAGKLNRNSITGEEVLIISVLLGIDIRKLQKEAYKQKFESGGNFMNSDKVIDIITRFKREGIEVTNKQKNYLDEWYSTGIHDLKYIYDRESEELYIWCDMEAFKSLSECEFYLTEEDSIMFIKIEDEVMMGFKNCDTSIDFIEMLIQIQNDEGIGGDGKYIEED